MAWTYDVTTNRGKVRFLVGDTDTTDQQLTDAEVDFLLSEQGGIYAAAAEGCDALAAKYSRQADTEVGDLSVKKSQRALAYLKLGVKLRGRASQNASVYVPSISISDKQTSEEDTDIPAPKFFVGQHSYPGNAQTGPSTDEKDEIL